MTIYEWMDKINAEMSKAYDWDLAYESGKSPGKAVSEMACRRVARDAVRDTYGDRGRTASPVPH